jgi:hypothetical protein
MMGGIHEYNKTGQMKRPSYKDIVAWIVESWAAVNGNCVRNGFIVPHLRRFSGLRERIDKGGGHLESGVSGKNTPLLVAVSERLGQLSFEAVAANRWVLSPLPEEHSSRRRQGGIC